MRVVGDLFGCIAIDFIAFSAYSRVQLERHVYSQLNVSKGGKVC